MITLFATLLRGGASLRVNMKNTSLLLCFIVLTSCVFAAPVQEMSDARQAIRSAEDAGASQLSPETLAAAQELLQQAQYWLDLKAYSNARYYALGARDEAIIARENALSKSVLNTTIRVPSG